MSIGRNGIRMSAKDFFKAVGKAVAYFAVYYVWQVIAVNFVAAGAAVSALSQYEGGLNDYYAFADEIYYNVYETVNRFSLHITVAAGLLTLITYFIIFKLRGKKPLFEVGITKLPFSQIPILILFGFSLNMLVSVIIGIIPFPESWIESYAESTAVISEAGIAITLITTLICAPIVEEVTFRGLIYSRLAKGMPMFAAMLISAWIFGVAHGNVIQMLYASLIGYIICYIRIKYNSLTASILVHFGFNLFSVAMSFIGETDQFILGLIMIAGAALSLALLIYIMNTNKYKVEYTFGGQNG